MESLYEYPTDYVGRKTYVTVRGHVHDRPFRGVPAYKTYRGVNGLNYLRPEYGGDWSGLSNTSAIVMPDKAAYKSPLDFTVVEGRAAHREHMARHGVIEAGDMPHRYFDGLDRSPMPSVGKDIVRAMQELSSR